MANIVLVHGIDQQQRSADSLEAEWMPDLAGGVRIAGYPDIADSIWRPEHGRAEIDTRMAFYGDLFLMPDQQGEDDAALDEEERVLVEGLALEWLERAAARSASKKTQQAAIRELSYLRDEIGTEPQGARALVRRTVKGISRVPWFARFGMAFAERFVFRSLAQVSKYLANESIRAEAQSRVSVLITPETKVIIAHSLGSVVAFEAAHRLKQRLPLLITLGSPLGLETIVYQKLQPQPPTFPPLVDRWVNVADRDDLVAAEPNMALLFEKSLPSTSTLESHWTVDNGAEPHRVNFYLTKKAIGLPIAQTLQAG